MSDNAAGGNNNQQGNAPPPFLLMSLYGKCLEWQTAYSIYQQHVVSGIRPDAQMVSSAIDVFWQAGSAPACVLALSLFEEACKLGVVR
jgi:hypothetical protein